MNEHEHTWELEERGYVRRWGTELSADETELRATYRGTSDWSEDGAGAPYVLVCTSCLDERPLPDGVEIIWD